VPLTVGSDKVEVLPVQTEVVPVIAAGVGFIVIDAVVDEHPTDAA
jgi:hypothetical protein